MAIKDIIASGVGFSPGSTKFIPTRGFIAAAAGSDDGEGTIVYARASSATSGQVKMSEDTDGAARMSGTTQSNSR